MSIVREDLEALTGSLLMGPVTPILYNILKDSPCKEDILNYRDLISKERREEVVSKQNTSSNNIEVDDGRVSFEEWLRDIGKPVSI